MSQFPTRHAVWLYVALAAATPLAGQSTTAPGASANAPLTLGEAARMAARQSLGAEVAGLRADAASARAAQARAGLMPSVSAVMSDGQRTFNTASFGLPLPGFNPNGQIIGPVRTADIRARMEATLYAPSAIGRYRAAQSAASTAAADAQSAAEASAATAALAYLRLLRAEAQVQARAADSALAAELLGIARSQVEAGTGTALDITRARAQLANLRTQLIAARSERERAQLSLQRALSLPLGQPLALGDSLANLVGSSSSLPTEREAALSSAKESRPDLRAATQAVESSRRAIAATKAEALPRLAVFGDNGYTSNGYAHLLNTYSYGIALSVPIWEGGRRESRLGEQAAVLHEAEARLRDLTQQVEADVQSAVVDLSSATEQLDASSDRLQLAEQELAQARERFRAGVAGNADVIAAQLALDLARSQHIDVQTNLVAARVNLARAEGRVTQLP